MIRPRNTARRRLMWAARRLATSDDSGTTLLIALIFITVVSVVIAAILGFVAVNMRGTVAVRAEASQAGAADGAAQIAINKLRQGSYNLSNSGQQCFGPTQQTLSLAGFYQNAGSTYSATVTCDLDGDHSTITGNGPPINGSNRPGQAILTLGTSLAEIGLKLNANGSQNSIIVHGAIRSNSNIAVDQLASNTTVIATGACTGSYTVPPGAKQCNTGTTVPDPGTGATAGLWQPSDVASRTVQSVPACRGNKKVVTFTPGIYTDINGLNGLTNGPGNGCNGIYYFPHGTYYFDFTGKLTTEWTLTNGWVVGGDPNPGEVMDGHVPNMPGSCKSPVPPDPVPPGWTFPGIDDGVQFVFGGPSRIHLNQGSMELCAGFFNNKMPIAFYGLKSDLGSGATLVHGESGCVINVGGCSVISSDFAPDSKLFFQGTTYVPRAAVDIQLNNATGQVFRYGIVARRLMVNATGSADLSGPIIEVPDNSPGGALRTVLFLRVYVCPGSGSCSTSGTSPQLTVKVGIEDPGGTVVPGARQITVYDWSVQR